jgi:adenylosuccinate lyase
MPMAIELKGPFDQALRKYLDGNDAVVRRLDLDAAKPTVWTLKQRNDLAMIANMIENLANAVAEMAIRVRDD